MAHAGAPAPPATAPAELPPGADRVVRLYEALPAPPPVVGLGIALLHGAAFLLFHNVTGILNGLEPAIARPGFGRDLLAWELVNALIEAFLLTAHVMARRASFRDLLALRPHLRISDERFAADVRRTLCPSAASLLTVDAVAVASGLLIVALDPGVRAGAETTLRDPVLIWSVLRNVAVSFCVCRVLWADGVATLGFARIGAERVDIDWLDPRPLAAFSRKGQRSVALWVVFSCLLSLFWLGDRAGTVNTFLLASLIAVVTAAFWLPLRSVSRRIRSLRDAELERANREVHAARRALGRAESAPTRLADWEAWRRIVLAFPEWPVSTPTLVRVGFFVLLGVGSWLGGALVERGLQWLLD